MICYIDGCLEEDIKEVVEDLRWQDARSLRDFGSEPLEAFMDAFYNSRVHSMIVEDGEMMVVGLFGWIPFDGYVWMASTPMLQKYRRRFAREARRVVDTLLSRYSQLYTVVDPRNPQDIKFIEWLGFKFNSEYTANGVPYRVYTRT